MGGPNIRCAMPRPSRPETLASLRKKRIRIHRQLDKLEPLLAALLQSPAHDKLRSDEMHEVIRLY